MFPYFDEYGNIGGKSRVISAFVEIRGFTSPRVRGEVE
jgi:hypothetical protein